MNNTENSSDFAFLVISGPSNWEVDGASSTTKFGDNLICMEAEPRSQSWLNFGHAFKLFFHEPGSRVRHVPVGTAPAGSFGVHGTHTGMLHRRAPEHGHDLPT